MFHRVRLSVTHVMVQVVLPHKPLFGPCDANGDDVGVSCVYVLYHRLGVVRGC